MEYSVKYDAQLVRDSIARAVEQCKANHIIHDDVIYLVMLNGGVWFSSHVFDCMPTMENEVYYIKGHSYDGQQRGQLVWDYMPTMNLVDKDVVVLDDICDSGKTIEAIYDALHQQVKSLHFFTLLRRTSRSLRSDIQITTCIEDASEDFFVGCGLDDNGKGRMLPFVGVV